VRVEVYREVPCDQQIVALWNEFALKMEEPEVFFTWEWAYASARRVADVKRPFVAVVYEETQLIGIAALALPANQRAPVTFLNQGTADYCDFVSVPSARMLVISEVLHALAVRNIRDFVFNNLPEESVSVPCLDKIARELGFLVASTTSSRCLRLMLADKEERKDQKEELLKKRRLRKNLIALQTIGKVMMIEYTDAALIEKCLPVFFKAHVARFEARGLTSPCLSSNYRSFIETVTQLLASRRWIRMFCLQINGENIAWGIVLDFCNGWLWYMPTFCLEYEQFSPGMILLRMVLQKALDADSLRFVDFGVGEESYKDRFANSAVSIIGKIVTKSRYRYICLVIITKLAIGLKRFPRVDICIRRGRKIMYKLFRSAGQLTLT
jgi:CelD/BcsL family acetyltransferase involved in cellulose biosynthesis